MSDVTAQRKAEAALGASQERLRRFVEEAPVSVGMFDPQMRYLIVSRRGLQEFGRGYQDLIGRSHYEVHADVPETWRVVHHRAR